MSSKKTIGIIVFSNPDDLPPTANAIHLLSKKYKVVVICRNWERVVRSYPSDVKIYRLGPGSDMSQIQSTHRAKTILEFLTFIIKSIWLTIRYKIRTVYAYDIYGVCVAWVLMKLLRVQCVYHSHDLTDSKGSRILRLLKKIEASAARSSKIVVFPEKHRAEFFQTQTNIPKGKMVIAYNTPMRVDTLPEAKSRYLIQKNFSDIGSKRIVVYQGSIGPGHYFKEIIKSIEMWNDAVFFAFGKCPDEYRKKMMEWASEFGVEKKVFLFSDVSHDEIYQMIRGCDVGVSFYEGRNVNESNYATASNKIFEYIAMGVPLITGDFASSVDFFKDYSWAQCVDPRDPKQIGAAVNLWLSDPDKLAAAQIAAREAHLSDFYYENSFKPVMDGVDELMSK